MGATRRRFTAEYKAQAVGFILDQERSIVEVARSLGIHETTLGNWVKKEKGARAQEQDPDAPLSEPERQRLMRLEAEAAQKDAELAELRMQVEFSEKVAAWFASDQRWGSAPPGKVRRYRGLGRRR